MAWQKDGLGYREVIGSTSGAVKCHIGDMYSREINFVTHKRPPVLNNLSPIISDCYYRKVQSGIYAITVLATGPSNRGLSIVWWSKLSLMCVQYELICYTRKLPWRDILLIFSINFVSIEFMYFNVHLKYAYRHDLCDFLVERDKKLNKLMC